MNEVRFVDLFAGVGGFHKGLIQASQHLQEWIRERKHLQSKGTNENSSIRHGTVFSCVWANEWDKHASQIYKKRFPKTKFFEGDIRTVDINRLPNFDLLCGGFPCQAFSIAGKRKGFDDTRGTLFFEIAKILRAKKPKVVFLENVRGLLSHENGRTFGRIIEVLGDLGYWVEWEVLNSKNFGVPQNRERVFIIGHLAGESSKQVFPIGQSHGKTTKKHGEGRFMISNSPERENKRQNGRRFKEDGEEMFTLTGQDIHGVSNGKSVRRLTPVECERLQGFPDNWTEGLSDTQRYKCMGNAVTVNVIQAIGEKMLEVGLFEVKIIEGGYA